MSTQFRQSPEPFENDIDWEALVTMADPDDTALGELLADDLPLATHLALDILFDEGFTWEEGMRLLAMREGYYTHSETRERLTSDPHLGFARWLYQRGLLTS